MRRSKGAEGAWLQLQRLLQWWDQDDEDEDLGFGWWWWFQQEEEEEEEDDADDEDEEEGIAVVNTTPSCMFMLNNKGASHLLPHSILSHNIKLKSFIYYFLIKFLIKTIYFPICSF